MKLRATIDQNRTQCATTRGVSASGFVRRLAQLLAIALLTALLAGCSLFKTDAHVVSDTSWSGSFDGRTVEGRGNQDISLGHGTDAKCAVVQKQTSSGFLTVKIDHGEEKTTTAAFGVVSVCTH